MDIVPKNNTTHNNPTKDNLNRLPNNISSPNHISVPVGPPRPMLPFAGNISGKHLKPPSLLADLKKPKQLKSNHRPNTSAKTGPKTSVQMNPPSLANLAVNQIKKLKPSGTKLW